MRKTFTLLILLLMVSLAAFAGDTSPGEIATTDELTEHLAIMDAAPANVPAPVVIREAALLRSSERPMVSDRDTHAYLNAKWRGRIDGRPRASPLATRRT